VLQKLLIIAGMSFDRLAPVEHNYISWSGPCHRPFQACRRRTVVGPVSALGPLPDCCPAGSCWKSAVLCVW